MIRDFTKYYLFASYRAPDPDANQGYWVDLLADPLGRIIKVWDGEKWISFIDNLAPMGIEGSVQYKKDNHMAGTQTFWFNENNLGLYVKRLFVDNVEFIQLTTNQVQNMIDASISYYDEIITNYVNQKDELYYNNAITYTDENIQIHDNNPNSHQDIRTYIDSQDTYYYDTLSNDIVQKISAHNVDNMSHNDIRIHLDDVEEKVDALNGAFVRIGNVDLYTDQIIPDPSVLTPIALSIRPEYTEPQFGWVLIDKGQSSQGGLGIAQEWYYNDLGQWSPYGQPGQGELSNATDTVYGVVKGGSPGDITYSNGIGTIRLNTITDDKIGIRTVPVYDEALNYGTSAINGELTILLQRIVSGVKNLTGRFRTDLGHEHNGTDSKKISYGNILNTPSSLPANGGNADTVDNKTPNQILNYFAPTIKNTVVFSKTELDNNDKFLCNLSTSDTITLSGDLTVGKMYIFVIINNGTSTITITRPSGTNDSTNNNSVQISTNKEVEISVWFDGNKRRWLYSEEM